MIDIDAEVMGECAGKQTGTESGPIVVPQPRIAIQICLVQLAVCDSIAVRYPRNLDPEIARQCKNNDFGGYEIDVHQANRIRKTVKIIFVTGICCNSQYQQFSWSAA